MERRRLLPAPLESSQPVGQRQVASMQETPPAQSAESRHSGAASPAVTHSPAWQMVAAPHRQQSALVWQPKRQVPFTQL